MCGIVDREKLAAWRRVDWANTVAGEHPEPHPAARHTLSQARPGVLRAAEAVGCPRKTDGHGWETRVSEAPQDMVGAVLPLFWSEATHGWAMRRRVIVDDAARRCLTLCGDLVELGGRWLRCPRMELLTTLNAPRPQREPTPASLAPQVALYWTLEATMHATIVNADTQLPEELRRALNLRPGQAVALIPENGSMSIVPVPTLEELCGVLEGVDTHDLREREER